MSHTIKDERSLPAPSIPLAGRGDALLEYVRSKCEPTIMIACRTGENYIRDDGANWEWPAYKVWASATNGVTVEPWTCGEDCTVYDGSEERRVDHAEKRGKGRKAA